MRPAVEVLLSTCCEPDVSPQSLQYLPQSPQYLQSFQNLPQSQMAGRPDPEREAVPEREAAVRLSEVVRVVQAAPDLEPVG